MIDLHSHTTASDGQHEPSALIALAKAAGVSQLAVTDHDTLGGLAQAEQAARSLGGISVIPGIEVSTEIAGADIHILGHFVRPDDARLLAYCAHQEGERRGRMERMVQKLNELGYPVQMAHVERIAGSDNLCRPHLARALVELGYCRDTQDAFSKFIGDDGPAFSAQQRLSAAEVIQLLHAAGGSATLAHPGADKIDRYQLKLLKDAGLDGLEVFHSDHNPSVREKYLKLAKELDLVPSAGSDFHGEAVSPNAKLGIIGLAPEYFEALKARAGRA